MRLLKVNNHKQNYKSQFFVAPSRKQNLTQVNVKYFTCCKLKGIFGAEYQHPLLGPSRPKDNGNINDSVFHIQRDGAVRNKRNYYCPKTRFHDLLSLAIKAEIFICQVAFLRNVR